MATATKTKPSHTETFGDRLLALKGDDSFVSLAAKMKQRGIEVSAQALHKWAQGGGISQENLRDVAKYFNVSPSMLYFGETAVAADGLSEDAVLLARALGQIPDRFRKELSRDILKLAAAYTDEKDNRTLSVQLKRAVDKL